ncbi:MAG: hypothetical protein WBN40_01890 [Pseudomonadales bacterium]
MFRLRLLVGLLGAVLSVSVLATEYVVQVNGIVCEFCAFGVAKNIRKLDFIDSSRLQKGVRVDIENQQVFVAVKDGSELDEAVLFKAIVKGGYDPISIARVSEVQNQGVVEP